MGNILCEKQLGKSHRINILTVLINTHIAGSNFVNEDNLVIVVAKLKFNIPKVKADGFQVICHSLVFRINELQECCRCGSTLLQSTRFGLLNHFRTGIHIDFHAAVFLTAGCG